MLKLRLSAFDPNWRNAAEQLTFIIRLLVALDILDLSL